MRLDRPKHRKGTRPVPPPAETVELVEIVHVETGHTKFVRRARVATLAPAWQIVADEPPVITSEPNGSDTEE